MNRILALIAQLKAAAAAALTVVAGVKLILPDIMLLISQLKALLLAAKEEASKASAQAKAEQEATVEAPHDLPPQ